MKRTSFAKMLYNSVIFNWLLKTLVGTLVCNFLYSLTLTTGIPWSLGSLWNSSTGQEVEPGRSIAMLYHDALWTLIINLNLSDSTLYMYYWSPFSHLLLSFYLFVIQCLLLMFGWPRMCSGSSFLGFPCSVLNDWWMMLPWWWVLESLLLTFNNVSLLFTFCLQILVQHIKTVLPGLKARINAQLVAVAKEHAAYGDITESKVSYPLKWLIENDCH